MDDARFARELWWRLEPLHAVTYFAPESLEAAGDVGVNGFWRTYFAFRAAPLGRCSAATATAAFFGFAPSMVARAIPSVWELASPSALLAARAAGAAAALRRLAPDDLPLLLDDSWTIGALAETVNRGKAGTLALYLGNREVPPPDDPVAALWQLATTLREHRGDGHVVSWTARGFAPIDVAVLFVAAGGTSRHALQPHRGWTDDEWADAVEGNRRRGLLGGDTAVTAAGREVVDEVERNTDRLAAAVFTPLDDAARRRLLDALTPVAAAVARSGIIPAVNPMGVPLLGDGQGEPPAR
ncbi:MAG: hypothetical protein AAGD35_11575 [Actinomycetota bacterium]